MGRAGKYVRHILAGIVGWAAAEAGARFGFTLDGETEAAIVVIVYAVVEKALKRFGWLDPEGAADRLAIKEEAAALRRPGW